MNYPIWELPSSGLLIAFVAIVHVFISHFAVGGGLFLVVTERRARRLDDERLLAYVRWHSRFFVLLTLVAGALTGVGIWFTIGLVHPSATSALIQTWVWGWAIEWTFFAVEIAAAMVYYYGWDRLDARTHLAVGWVYFVSAWLSLVVINGILAYMLTPGDWLVTRGFFDGFFNPTYWPSLVARTFVCVGLAGLYALFTVAWSRDRSLRAQVARYAGLGWIIPMAVALPLSLVWYLAAADGAGVGVATVFGAADGTASTIVSSLFAPTSTGHPVVRAAAQVSLLASLALVVITLAIVLTRHLVMARTLASLAMVAGLLAFGGAEWVREGLRKPYVIGRVMFVNAVRMPAASGARPTAVPDAFTVDALNAGGLLKASAWTRLPDVDDATVDEVTYATAEGREVFKILCSSCHTVDGHLGVRPLVQGRGVDALTGMLGRLADPVDAAGVPTSWSNPAVQLTTWRGRRMPPFVGTDHEKRALAVYLAHLGGAGAEALASALSGGAGVDDLGRRFFEENCSMCHGDGGGWPFVGRPPRSADEFYEMLGKLPELNEMMPAFPGSDTERRAVAAHLAALTAGPDAKESAR